MNLTDSMERTSKMSTSKLTGGNIIAIIKACNENRVSNFELGPLKIKFGEADEIVSPTQQKSKAVSPVIGTESEDSKKPEQLDFEDLEELRVIRDEYEMNLLALSNPSKFEEESLKGDHENR